MEENFYSPSLMSELLSSGMQGFPTQQPVQTAPYYEDYGFDPNDLSGFDMYGLGEYASQFYQQQTPQSGVAAAQSATPPGALPPGMSWGAYSDPNDPTSQYTVTFTSEKKGDRPLTVTPETPVLLYDNRTKQIVASGVGAQGANAVAEAVSSLAATNKDAWWDIYTGTPGATDPSQFKVAVSDNKNPSFWGRLADIALPALGAVLAPMTGGLSAALGSVGSAAAGSALGSALSGTLQGRDLGDILKGAALSGGLTYAGGSLLGDALGSSVNTSAFDAAFSPEYASWLASGANTAAPAIAGGGLAGLGGSFAGTDALGNFIQVAGSTGSNIPTSVLNAALAAASAAPGLINYGNQVWGEQPPSQGGDANQSYIDPTTGDIVVPAGSTNFPIDPNSILAGFLGSQFPPINSVDIPTDLANEWPEVPVDENEIVVTGKPTPITPIIPPVPVPIGGTPGGVPSQPTQPTQKPPSTIDEIIKYIGIGSTVGGGLLDLLGVGQPKAPAATPYTPVLGAAPNFGRGPFTPFTGDYERYAFGPEWNFFGGAQASTPANG